MRARDATIALGIGAAVILSLSITLSGQVPGAAPNQTVPAWLWPPDRLPDGQPDVQGLWNAVINGTVTRPWTLRVAERRVPEEEIWEFACYEGERSADQMLITDTGKN